MYSDTENAASSYGIPIRMRHRGCFAFINAESVGFSCRRNVVYVHIDTRGERWRTIGLAMAAMAADKN